MNPKNGFSFSHLFCDLSDSLLPSQKILEQNKTRTLHIKRVVKKSDATPSLN